MTSSSLTIIGGSARAAAQSAVRAGFSPVAGDLFGDEDLRQLCPTTRVDDFPAGLEQVCAGPQTGAWLYTGALENHPHLIARMSKIRPLLGNGADTIRQVRDPFALAAAFKRGGFPTLSLSRTADGLPRDGSWLRKPYRSAGGTEISVWEAANTANPNSKSFYYQSFATGQVCGAVYVAAGNEARLLGVSEQLPADGSFLYHGSVGPIGFSDALQSQIEQLGSLLAAEFGLVGLFGVDVVIQGDIAWPLEVNPRYTASVELLERTLGIRALAWHVSACLGEPLPPAPVVNSRQVAAKQILYAPSDLSVPGDLVATLFQKNTDNAWPSFADLPAAGSVIRAGWPILTVFGEANDLMSVKQSLEQPKSLVARLLGLPPDAFP